MPNIPQNSSVGKVSGSHESRTSIDALKLSTLHLAWKVLLLALVLASPGNGYDTSTKLLFDQYQSTEKAYLVEAALRLTRWDGIYFSSMSAHGLVYEQQWAFSWAYTRFIAFLDRVSATSSLPTIVRCSLIASCISHISHCATILLLYLFIMKILPSSYARKRDIAFTTACLQIVSPAGIFLIAPYLESTFSMLGMAGALFHAHAISYRLHAKSLVVESIMTVLAGLSFGFATLIRTNGLLYGMIFAWDAVNISLSMLFGSRDAIRFFRLTAIVIAGTLTGLGYAIPQVVAYREYCTGHTIRFWCALTIPSIYSWVQSHYWEVGLFRYWKLSNLPLFILATPVLYLLLNTGYAALHHIRTVLIAVNGEETPRFRNDVKFQTDRFVFEHIMERHGLIQIVLALLALTSFHVQIINRISSAYPAWFFVIAVAIHDQSPQLGCGHARSEHFYPFRWLKGNFRKTIVAGFVLYSVVQAGLYASFLPPA